MPSISLPAQSFSVTAVNYSDLTVAANIGSSTVNLYAGLIGYVVGPGGTPASVRISIVAVESPGVIRVQVAPFQGTGGSTIQANFNAFNGGTLSFEAQLATVASIYLDSGQVASGDLGGNYPNPIVVSGANLGAGTVPGNAVAPATPSSPGASQSGMQTFTVQFSDAAFKAAASSVAVTLFTLAANQRLTKWSVVPKTAFAGTGLTACTVSVGTATSGRSDQYLSAVDLMTVNLPLTVPNSASQVGCVGPNDFGDTSRDIVATFTATGANFGSGAATNLSAGSVGITLEITTLPA